MISGDEGPLKRKTCKKKLNQKKKNMEIEKNINSNTLNIHINKLNRLEEKEKKIIRVRNKHEGSFITIKVFIMKISGKSQPNIS